MYKAPLMQRQGQNQLLAMNMAVRRQQSDSSIMSKGEMELKKNEGKKGNASFFNRESSFKNGDLTFFVFIYSWKTVYTCTMYIDRISPISLQAPSFTSSLFI